MSMAMRRKLLSIEDGVSKYLASSESPMVFFKTKQETPVKTIAQLRVVQTGTGDPSLINIRPIVGWSGCNFYNINWTEKSFGPIQNGSGNPSPSNVREILPGLNITRDDGTTLTVYGGTLTVNDDGTGTLEKDQDLFTFDGTETYVTYSATGLNGFNTTAFESSMASGNAILCNMLPTSSATNVSGIRHSSSRIYIYGAVQTFELTDSTVETFKAYLADLYTNNTPLYFTAKIATPVTYNLSADETRKAIIEIMNDSEHMVELNWSEHSIALTQAGSGTPSPTNVRTISPGLTFIRDDSTTLTIYGGKLLLNSDGTSSLTSTMGYAEFTSGAHASSNSSYYTNKTSTYAYVDGGFKYKKLSSSNISMPYSNWLEYKNNSLWGQNQSNAFGYHTNSSGAYFAIRVAYDVIGVTGEETPSEQVAKINEYLAEHPLQILAELATPIVYTLSEAETKRALAAINETGIIYGGKVILKEDGSAEATSDYTSAAVGSAGYGLSRVTSYLKTFNEVEYANAYCYTASGWQLGQIAVANECYCDRVKIVTNTNQITGGEPAVIKPNAASTASSFDFYVKTSELDDVSTAQNACNSIAKWFRDNNVHLVWRTRANLITKSFVSVNTLSSFSGDNHLFDNGNGQIGVFYDKKGKPYNHYPIGTGILSKFIGNNGQYRNWIINYDLSGVTGDIVYSSGSVTSPVYIPINENYTYTKGTSRAWVKCYDEDLKLLGSQNYNNLDRVTLTFSEGTKFIRVSSNTSNKGLEIFRTA